MTPLAEFRARLAATQQALAELHIEAERLKLSQAVVMGLLWLRDDATSTLRDADTGAPHPLGLQ